jgi:hypothetical protein
MFVSLRAPRFHAQSSVARAAFPQSAWCYLASEKLPDGTARHGACGTESRLGCFNQDTTNGEAGLKTELQKVRAMAEARIKSGSVPDWSWQQHVQLIEAVDAMLHDISVVEKAHHAKRYTGGSLRLVTDNPESSGVRRKTGSMH